MPTPTQRHAAPAARSRRVSALPRPREGRLLDSDIVAIIAAVVTCVVGIWVRHGGVSALGNGWTAASTSVAQLSGLLASLAGLFGIMLVARPRAIERAYGLDRLFVWHRYLGETMAVVLGVHVVAGIVEWAQGATVWSAVRDAIGRQPYMAGATVGALLITLVTVTSLRSVRNRMAYETWYFVHLLAYFAVAISFGHQIVVGGSLANDRVARWFWVGLHLAVAACLVVSRWGTTVRAALDPLEVRSITRLTDDTVTIRLAGPALRRVEAEAGQFFLLRPLTPSLWWQTHPFSLSATPTTSGLEFSVKRRGDGSGEFARLQVGTKVAVEGPYGVGTPQAAAGRKMLFIAGGIGIAPIRALMQRLPAGTNPVLLYRAHGEHDLVHLAELQQLAESTGGEIRTLVGPTAKLTTKDPFGAASLRAACPDVADRVAVLCGPERLVAAARRGLLDAGVDSIDIHYERAWW
mgnify:CR=1 FL=1